MEEEKDLDIEFEKKLKEYTSQFIAEAGELTDKIEQELLELEKTGFNKELLNSIFRSFHTIKGTAGFMGFERTVELCHKTETLFSKMRDGELTPSSEIVDLAFASLDRLRELIKSVAETGTEGNIKVDDIVNRLLTAVEAPEEKLEVVEDKIKEKERKVAQETLRISTQKIEEMMGLAEELVLSRNMLMKAMSQVEAKYSKDEDVMNLAEIAAGMDKVISLLRFATMKMRMIPINTVFSKFPRVTRDLARAFGKKIELVIEGETTELDRNIVDEMEEPLVHLVRNAVDHGIEPPEERTRLGKTPEGHIFLRAYYEGDAVVIDVEDDGKGINPEVIRAKAIRSGLISEEEAERMTDKEVINLIFTPGFSSKDEVTEISGRGFGMDVVRDKIIYLKGTLDIESEVGEGTKIIMRLPLTVGIMNTLHVISNSRDYLIPLSAVLEITRISDNAIKIARGQEVMSWRGIMIPIVRLSKIFGFGEEKRDIVHIVIVGAAEKRLGILVDSVISSEEVAVKSLGDMFEGAAGVAGATLSSSGEPMLIIDIPSMIQVLEKG